MTRCRDSDLADASTVRVSRVRDIGGILVASYLLALVGIALFGMAMGYRSGVNALDQDELEYWRLGRSMIESGTFPVGRRTPVFPLLIGGLQAVSDFSLQSVSVAISLVYATSAPLAAMLAYRVSGDKVAALLAGAATALWPPSLFFGTSIYSETLALPMFLAFLLLLPWRRDRDGGASMRWIGAGAALAVCALTRPMYLMFVPVMGLVVLLDQRSIKGAATSFALALAGFCLALLPWSAYASFKSGHSILLSANGGETLAGGFNPTLLSMKPNVTRAERRTYVAEPGRWILAGDTGYLTADEEKLDYFAQDKILRQRTFEWIVANPADAFYLLFCKLAYMWGYAPSAPEGVLKQLFGNLPIIILQVMFVWAILTCKRIRREGARFYLLPLFAIMVATISWGSWRFRQPADVGMLIVVAVAVADRGRTLRRAPSWPSVARSHGE